MSNSAMLDAALSWAAAGFPVFPCSPKSGRGGKRPLTPKESAPGAKDGGLYVATTDEKQIRQWWSKWPKALIGMPTGAVSGTVVIDLDPRETDADTMRLALEEWVGGLDGVDEGTGEILTPWLSLTQSGGLHLWFMHPAPAKDAPFADWSTIYTPAKIPNRANLFKAVEDAPGAIASHVDVRGDGGYVIVPPSAMDDGKTYRWLDGGIGKNSPPLPPPRLLDLICRRGEFARGNPNPDPEPRAIAGSARPTVGAGDAQERARRKYAETALSNATAEVARSGAGSRNQTLNDKALALGHLVGAGLLSEGEVRAALENAAASCGLVKDDGIEQCRKTIASGLRAGMAEPADVSAIGTRAGKGGQRPPTPEPADYGNGHAGGPARQAGSRRPNGTAEPDDNAPQANAGDRLDGDPVDPELVEYCASLDHSDTDNARRLQTHFGHDLVVLAQSKARVAQWGAWTGTHWDFETGGSRAFAIAQKVGGRIALEAEFVKLTPKEVKAVELGRSFLKTPDKKLDEDEKFLKDQAVSAQKDYDKRVERKFAWGVTSKNKGRIEAMLACHAPHCLVPPEAFNADPLTFAARNATLTFRRDHALHGADVAVRKSHRRGDYITQVIPVDYDPKAECPLWIAFIERMLPDPDVRKLVQVASGLGLIGLTVQKLFFHYGSGANGKSVYMETMCRLLADAAVTLPATSFFGEGGSGGGASPDIARLYGRRHLRVKEIPQGEDLREELVKEVTGGEELTARDLFSGYFDFRPIFTAHMSGNGYPKITGTDNGIWRRMAVIHWPVKLDEKEQRDFEDVVSEFEPEYSGILNWLIAGVLTYLDEGLVIPEAVKVATQEYRDEMDPTSAFCAACVVPVEGSEVAAKELYEAYVAYVKDQGGKDARPLSHVRFGKIMQSKYERHHDGRNVVYRNIALASVPTRSDDQPGYGDYPDDYGGRP